MTQSTFSNGYALLVGAGSDLPVTAQDATALYNLLVDPNRASYPAEQVDLLTEASARRQDILDGFARLAQDINQNPEATAIVYFSGHGYRVERSGHQPAHYLLPNGYNLSKLDETAITAQEFTSSIEAIKARKLIVLLDCCHAGGMPDLKDPGVKLVKSPAPPELLSALDSGSGRVVIASSTEAEFSYVLPGANNSLFTTCLIEALGGKDTSDADGFARILQVLIYLFKQVPLRTQNMQHLFVKKVLDLGDNFPLCYAAGGAKSVAGEVGMPVAPRAPIMTDSKRKRWKEKREGIQQAFDLLSGRVIALRNAEQIEAGVAVRYHLTQQLLIEEVNLAKLEAQLEEIEQALQ